MLISLIMVHRNTDGIRLLIQRSAMWAGAFLFHLATTLATTVAVMGMALIAPHSKGDVGDEQEVADVVECEDAENDIDDSTDGSET